MEALVKVINEQWAVVMTAPAAFLAALALGALVGWFAAWIILKQRLRLAANQLKCGGDTFGRRCARNGRQNFPRMNRGRSFARLKNQSSH
jgi:hypothetical protein